MLANLARRVGARIEGDRPGSIRDLLRVRHVVDRTHVEHPGRHRWSRRRLRREPAERVEDWSVLWWGWPVGRVTQVAPGFHRVGEWHWAVQTYPASSGYAASMEEGLERVRQGVSFGPDGLPNVPAASHLRLVRRQGMSPGGEPGPR